MNRNLTKGAAAILVGLGILAAPAHAGSQNSHYPQAQAAELLTPAGNRGADQGRRYNDGYRGDRHGDRDFRDGRHWQVRYCSDWRALEKARWMGIRHAHVTRSGHKGVKVSGRKYGHRVSVTFARAPWCPVVAYNR